MMRVYICPDCGWMRMVSRRKNVECYKCGVQDMTLAKVDFATYVSWSEKVRTRFIFADSQLLPGCTYTVREKQKGIRKNSCRK